MSMAWYINRLVSMSPSEVAHRVSEQVKRRVSQHTSYGWAHFAADGPLPRLPGFGDAFAARASEPLKAAVRAAADRLLEGHFSALGVDWPQRPPELLFPPEIWRLDPVSGQLWPGAEHYCFTIPYRHERQKGDVKYVWELNRLQFLQPLAAAAALFSDRRALAAVDGAIASWAEANPPFQGLGWNSGIELAVRAVSILVAVSLCGEALRPETQKLIRPLLKAHLFWLNRYPSGFSSANNHLVAELMGQYLIGHSLRDAQALALAKRAGRALARQAELQILADGAPAEQSPTYGAFTAEMLLACAVTARALGERLDPVIDARLERFAGFVAILANRDGTVPAIGDDDEGRILTLCTPEPTYPASVARAIAGHLGQASQISAAIAPQLRDALVPAPAAAHGPEDGVFTFPDGGYSVVRGKAAGRRLILTVDHGPLGYLSIAAHGHADANAIAVSIDDKPVFIDPGTYLYHSGAEWRDWFRGTRAHNTVTLAGADQSQILGAFNWGHRAKSALIGVETGADWSILTSHDGYAQRFGLHHRRSVKALPEGFVIRDEILPALGHQTAEFVLQLASDLHVVSIGDIYRVYRAEEPLLDIAFDSVGRVSIARGEPGRDGGWMSPHFGAKIAASRLSWLGQIPAAGLRTRIKLIPRAEPDASH